MSGSRCSRRFCGLVLAFAGSLAAAPAAFSESGARLHETRIETPEVRIAEWPDRIRLVVESKGRLPWQRFDFENTDTVVVPLDGIDARGLRPALAAALITSHPLIREYRVEGENRMPRLELSLRRPARVKLFLLRPMDGHGYRLVLDLFPLSGEDVNVSPRENTALRALASGTSAGTQELWLATQVNHRPDVRTVLVLKQRDSLWLSKTDLQRWGITLPETKRRMWSGEEYVSLSDTDIHPVLNMQQLALELEVPVDMLRLTRLGENNRAWTEPSTSPFGAFLNYDVNVMRDAHDDRIRREGFFELGVFNEWGSGTSSLITRDTGDEREFTRLDTTWRKDNPANMRSLILGDTINGGTGWSGAVRFAGVHWGTNFSTRPEFITMPLVSLAGDAAVPSTVDLYVNDALRWRESVSAGPFSIDEIPTVTGTGQVRMVVRDMFGREQVITHDFYSSAGLLREGLQEWSLDVGTLRESYGTESNDYGGEIFAATWRRGVSEAFTVEGHTQATGQHRMGGIGLRWKTPLHGTLTVAGAASDGESGPGSLASAGFHHQGARLSFSAETQYASETFRRVGVSTANPLPGLQHRVHVGAGNTPLGSASLGYTTQRYYDDNDIEFLTLNVSRNLGPYLHLGVSAFHFPDTHETGLQALLTVPLGHGPTTASIGGSARFGNEASDDSVSGSAQLQRSLPSGTGVGYRLRTGLGDDEFDHAAVSYQNNVGTWTLEGSRNHDITALRASARGGIALLEGNVLASRYIDQSFAVVDVGDFEDVRVYADNQVVARTNKRGVALIPRLRAYEQNSISAEQADLPLSAAAGGLHRTVSPYFRSGVLVRFDAAESHNALFRLVNNGAPLPAGARVLDEHGNIFPVGLDGQVYITGLNTINRLRAEWEGRSCAFELSIPEKDDDVPYAEPGEIECAD